MSLSRPQQNQDAISSAATKHGFYTRETEGRAATAPNAVKEWLGLHWPPCGWSYWTAGDLSPGRQVMSKANAVRDEVSECVTKQDNRLAPFQRVVRPVHSEHRRLACTRANGPVRAKADLAHGEWGDCSMKPCCLLANGRLERLMAIANHPLLSNTTHASPSACRCWQSRVTRAVTRAVCVRHQDPIPTVRDR